MCLILLAWRTRGDLPLVVAANRDEFHARPAAAAAFWTDLPGILAGRDLQAKGTWMGVSRTGRFAAVTNYRGAHEPSAAESRGALVSRFLAGEQPAAQYAAEVQSRKDRYSGFNLLLGDGAELWSLSNRDGPPRRLDAGVYGLGNTLLDAPEVDAAKARFREALEPPSAEGFFSVLREARILDPRYGTRCSTVLLHRGHGMRYAERRYHPDGGEDETLHFSLSIAA